MFFFPENSVAASNRIKYSTVSNFFRHVHRQRQSYSKEVTSDVHSVINTATL